MKTERRKDTKWIQNKFELIRDALEGNEDLTTSYDAQRKDAGSALTFLVDALYKATKKRNKRDGSGERHALFEIKAQVRTVYQNLSFDAKPSTVAKFVKMVMIDLAEARRANERLADQIVSLTERLHAAPGSGTEPAYPVEKPWKPDPEKAPETQKSSPAVVPVQFPQIDDPTRRDPVINTGEPTVSIPNPLPEYTTAAASFSASEPENFGKAGFGG